jgi:hypothetical protein
VLGFAAAKIVGARWFHVPPLLSVVIIAVCIGNAIVASLVATRRERARARVQQQAPPSRRAPATPKLTT